jgi:hypothetical protein
MSIYVFSGRFTGQGHISEFLGHRSQNPVRTIGLLFQIYFSKFNRSRKKVMEEQTTKERSQFAQMDRLRNDFTTAGRFLAYAV